MTAEAVFDRTVVRAHRDRAAASGNAEFLFEQAAQDLVDRLANINRRFDKALVVGSRRGLVAQLLRQNGHGGLIVQGDLSQAMSNASRQNQADAPVVVFDEELIPFGSHSLDLIVCPLTLHWLNDLPGSLVQLHRALMPDGLLLANLLGGATLDGLRRTMLEVELELLGGASQRISPVIDLRDAAGLMQRAGFSLPVADIETVDVTYSTAAALLTDLRAMGETTALMRRDRRTPPRQFWPMVIERYDRKMAGPDGRVKVQFEILTLTGWHPHDNQQKALRPGSAQASLAASLGTIEQGTGENAG